MQLGMKTLSSATPSYFLLLYEANVNSIVPPILVTITYFIPAKNMYMVFCHQIMQYLCAATTTNNYLL